MNKIYKLLEKLDYLAEHPGTPEEGKAASRKAAEIRVKYSISKFTTKREYNQFIIDDDMEAFINAYMERAEEMFKAINSWVVETSKNEDGEEFGSGI